jgi:hypothetical protein
MITIYIIQIGGRQFLCVGDVDSTLAQISAKLGITGEAMVTSIQSDAAFWAEMPNITLATKQGDYVMRAK